MTVIKKVLAFVFLVFFAVSFSYAKSATVIVEGIAPILSSKSNAKDQALLDAKIRAVEEHLGSYIKSQTKMVDYEIQYDIIEQRIEGFVSKYKILKENIEDKSYKVVIKATVKEKRIDMEIENLVSLLSYKKDPKFLIVSKEPSIVASIFETQIKQELLRRDIDVVDITKIKNGYSELINKKNNLIPYSRLGIDYVVFLDIAQQNLTTSYKGQLHESVSLHLTADVVDTSTLEIILTKKIPSKVADSKIIVKSDLIPSTTYLAQKFSKDLIIDISDKWKEGLYNGEQIILEIEGVKNHKTAHEVLDYLKEIIDGATSIQYKSLHKKISIYEIKIPGGLNTFLDQFVYNNDKYDMEILQQSGNRCLLKLHQ